MKKMKKGFFPIPLFLFPKNFELIWPYFKGQQWKLFGAVIVMVMSVPGAAVMSYLLKEFLDAKPIFGIWPLLAAAACFYALQIGATQLGRFAITNALLLLRTNLDVRKAHAREYGLIPANTFEGLITDIEGLEEALRSTLEMIQGVISAIGYLLAMYLIGSYTGLTASAVPVFFCIPMWVLYSTLLRSGIAHRALSSRANRAHRLASVHAGIRDFMTNNKRRSDGRMSRFTHVYGILDQDINVQKKISFLEGSIEWIARWSGIVSIVVTFTIAGAVPGPAGIAIVILLERYGDALVDVFKGGSGVQRGHVAMDRSIYKLLTLPQIQAPATSKPPISKGTLIVKNLSYAGIFGSVSFEACRSHPTVIGGQRGSGKTPLLEILCGLRTPSSGYVDIDGEARGAEELRNVVYPVFGVPFVSWELDTITTR